MTLTSAIVVKELVAIDSPPRTLARRQYAASFYGHQCHFMSLLVNQAHCQAYCHSMNINKSFIVGLGNLWSLSQTHRDCFLGVMAAVSGLANGCCIPGSGHWGTIPPGGFSHWIIWSKIGNPFSHPEFDIL